MRRRATFCAGELCFFHSHQFGPGTRAGRHNPAMNATVPAPLLQLREALGPQAVLIGADVPERNRNDWSSQAPTTPIAVVRPTDAAGVSAALKAYALLATSADKGAVRDLSKLEG